MATQSAGLRAHAEHVEFSADSAIRIAWGLWLVMLATPFLYALGTVWYAINRDGAPGNANLAQYWFVLAMGYLGIFVPLAFFWRSHLFRNYWIGKVVSPRHYLAGMCIVWSALEIGGLLSLTGCLLSGRILPNIIPALVAFVLFIPHWPKGNVMTRPLSDESDPGAYEEPR